MIGAVGLPSTFRAAVDEVSFAGRVVYIGYAKEPVGPRFGLRPRYFPTTAQPPGPTVRVNPSVGLMLVPSIG